MSQTHYRRHCWVFLSGPYTIGDQVLNVRSQMGWFDKVMAARILRPEPVKLVPFAPLWAHHQHQVFPASYEAWMAHDLAVLARCDVLLRCDASYPDLGYHVSESSGADREWDEAQRLGIPAFRNWNTLVMWVKANAGNLREVS